jgi:hypothetical protein
MNTTSRVFAEIMSPSVGHELIGSGFGLVEGTKVYSVAPTFLKIEANVVIAILSGFVQSSVTTSLVLLSNHDLISER